MNTTWKWSRTVYVLLPIILVLFIAVARFAQPDGDPVLKVMKTGLGSGTIRITDTSTGSVINCPPTCEVNYPTARTVELAAVVDPLDSFSRFSGWSGGCTVDPCSVSLTSTHWVKANFTVSPAIQEITDLTPEGIQTYLDQALHPENLVVNTPARFIAALPLEYKQNWILMSRSESLQTGLAASPRILLPSPDARFVFTVGMTQDSSYPGAHPNAIEYMQWDPVQKNFRFHEIILREIRDMGEIITIPDDPTTPLPDSTLMPTFPARPRRVSIDDAKCPKCHSTRNVLNMDRTGATPVRGSLPGTDLVPPDTAIPPATVMAKNKPNWDTYDSWGGMLPFNRDRIFKGSVEAAAFRKIFNLWTWSSNDPVRTVIEQLDLQPPDRLLPDGSVDLSRSIPREDVITRIAGGPNDGHIQFAFDMSSIVTSEPTPEGSPPTLVTYSFDRVPGSSGTFVTRGGDSVLLHHTSNVTSTGPNAEGRGVRFFDFLGGAQGIDTNGDGTIDANLNALRIADELATHRIAPGSVAIDVRPIALAITLGCISRSGDNVTPALTRGLDFFRNRNDGLRLSEMFNDTQQRAQSVPRRKADIQRMNLDRLQFDASFDPYLFRRSAPPTSPNGLLQEYSAGTSLTTTGVERLRQEVFRRPPVGGFLPDSVIGGFYVDREDYSVGVYNTEKTTLYRYFLEPLGVSVDKWSMGVRGRSRTYTFADVFDDSTYLDTITNGLITSLTADRFRITTVPARTLTAPFTCANPDLMVAVNDSFATLPADGSGVPFYTDIQRIFNKSCIECHGGLLYPPYANYTNRFLPAVFEVDEHFDLSEEEYPVRDGRRRMRRSYQNAERHISASDETAEIYTRTHNTGATREDCPGYFMPCGGPWLSQADMNTILRWIRGAPGYTEGDPHIRTLDGTSYDFQSAGEFVLLRGENLEIQTRQIPVDTDSPLPPNGHTELRSCVSLNGAVAVAIDGHRITYQPNNSGLPDPSGLQLRVDGKLSTLTAQGIPVASGVRIMQTTAPGGIRIESPGGSAIVITPALWDYHQLWHLNIYVERARATEGVMGAIAPGSWLPALPDGTSLGSKPTELHRRYVDLYERFEEAWRVTDATTLFDYAPGTSTGTFTIATWPIESPRTCQVPRDPDGPTPKPPLKTVSVEVAQQACAGIVANDRKTNCVNDVMVTGDVQFAKVYLLTDQIELNRDPTVPVLTSPGDYYRESKTELALPLTFTWNPVTDPDGDAVTYRHCVWVLGQLPDNNKCELSSPQTSSRRKAVFWALLLALLVCLLLLAFLIFVRKQKKPVLLILLVITLLASVVVAIYIRRTGTGAGRVARTVELQPGQDYSWKVIAEDGKGGISESETRRFKTK